LGKVHLLADSWQSLRREVHSVLLTAYDADEAEALSWWVVEETLHRERSLLVAQGYTQPLPIAEAEQAVERLLSHEPVQYVFGHCLWHGLDLRVTRDTLIPRPETAELVDWLLQEQTQSRCCLLDAGTGTGCIAIAIKQARPQWDIIGIDISAKAIDIARTNAMKNNAQVEWQQADILNEDNTNKWDIIVSNPPYIPLSEMRQMSANVIDYEPHTALFVSDADPLIFYRALARKKSKSLYAEVHEQQAQSVALIWQSAGYTDITIKNDIYGKPRMVRGRMA
jgi:release factor glutamine methyltransferase